MVSTWVESLPSLSELFSVKCSREVRTCPVSVLQMPEGSFQKFKVGVCFGFFFRITQRLWKGGFAARQALHFLKLDQPSRTWSAVNSLCTRP